MRASKDFYSRLDMQSLVDRTEIAHILGVGPTAVSNYSAHTNPRHLTFPEPVIVRSNGRFRLWDFGDIARWHRTTFPDRAAVWDDAWDRLLDYRKEQDR